MRNMPTLTSDGAVRSLGHLLVLAIVLLFAWRSAGWVWYFAAPSPSPTVPDLRGVVSIANVAKFSWFGEAPPSIVAAPVSGIRLIGVFSGGKRPTALLVIGNQNPTAVAIGEKPAPGLQLVTVAEDHVIILRNGINEKIALTGSVAPIQRENQSKDTPPP